MKKFEKLESLEEYLKNDRNQASKVIHEVTVYTLKKQD